MSQRLRINPITCTGHGLCAELFPERITLDDWGYPMIDGEPIPTALREHAERAAAACPVAALRLEGDRARNTTNGSRRSVAATDKL